MNRAASQISQKSVSIELNLEISNTILSGTNHILAAAQILWFIFFVSTFC